MVIKTTRFGEISISEESILNIPEGMLGFESCKHFVLLETQPDSPFKWLQSVDEPHLAFMVINPLDFFPDYDIDLPDDDADMLGLNCPMDAALLTTVTLDPDEGRATTNLLGPVAINSQNLRAKQIVLQDERYGTKHIIMEKQRVESTIETVKAA